MEKNTAAHQAIKKNGRAKLVSELSLQGTVHILDLGCGDGAITHQLTKLAPNSLVIGIDARGACS